MDLFHHLFWLQLVLERMRHLFSTFENTFWLRITADDAPEMRIWSILLIYPDLKWCILLSRSLFFIFGRYCTTHMHCITYKNVKIHCNCYSKLHKIKTEHVLNTYSTISFVSEKRAIRDTVEYGLVCMFVDTV